MSNVFKYKLKLILVNILVWIIAFRIFIFVRYHGYSSDMIDDLMPQSLILFRHNWYLSTLVGSIMGLIHGWLELNLFNTRWKHTRYLKLLIRRIAIYILSLVITTSLVFVVYNLIMKGQSIAQSMNQIDDFIFDMNYLTVSLFGLLMSIILFYFSQINKKLGDGELFNVLTGKYHLPREEQRIFMFLDLENSTAIAERLGHLKFSRLMQDCFAEISQFVIKHDAKVYQHVGDEVVLTWKYKFTYKPVFGLFYDFSNYLLANQDRYYKKYGLVPRFRAAVNAGIVTVAQVGYTKRETVYHGEVLIVAARMEKLCKEYGADMLITEYCIADLDNNVPYQFNEVGSIVLKGKSNSTLIYKVEFPVGDEVNSLS